MNRTIETFRLIRVGKIVRPHGVRGAVKVFPYGESLATRGAGDRVYLQPDSDDDRSELNIVSLTQQHRMLLVRFEELANKDEAMEVAGAEIFLPEDCLPPPSDNEYYQYQLLGLKVETLQGRRIGTLRGILETGDADVYSIDFHGKEILIPAVDEIIVKIDLKQGLIVVDPPEGLIDDL